MASPRPIDLKDGRERGVKYGTLALGECERDIFKGRATVPVLLEHWDVEPPRYLVAGLLWAGLRWQEPLLTYPQACAMVDAYVDGRGPGDPRPIGVLMMPIFKALEDAGILRLTKRGPENGTGAPAEGSDPNGRTRSSHSGRSSDGSTTSSRSSAAGTTEAPKKSAGRRSGTS